MAAWSAPRRDPVVVRFGVLQPQGGNSRAGLDLSLNLRLAIGPVLPHDPIVDDSIGR